jgi:hypothetical protein
MTQSLQLHPSSDASSSDFEDDDFLDIADEFGHVVDCVPEEGQMGFADFPFSGFIDYSRHLVRLARTNQPPPPKPGISNDLELNVARATGEALALELDRIYNGQQWNPLDPYVMNYVELFSAIRNYERNKQDALLQQEAQIREALAFTPDSEGGETE